MRGGAPGDAATRCPRNFGGAGQLNPRPHATRRRRQPREGATAKMPRFTPRDPSQRGGGPPPKSQDAAVHTEGPEPDGGSSETPPGPSRGGNRKDAPEQGAKPPHRWPNRRTRARRRAPIGAWDPKRRMRTTSPSLFAARRSTWVGRNEPKPHRQAGTCRRQTRENTAANGPARPLRREAEHLARPQ